MSEADKSAPAKPEFHPLADIFPLLNEKGEEFKALVDDINQNGLRHAITIYDGKILDGRNRDRACHAAHVRPEYQELPKGKDPLAFVISANLHRRHLTESQRAVAAAQVANIKLGGNQHTGKQGTPIGRASKIFNVGERSINRARAVLANDAIPALKDAVKQGAVKVAAAEKLLDLSAEEKQKLAAGGIDAIRAAVKNIGGSSTTFEDAQQKLVRKLVEIRDPKEAESTAQKTIIEACEI